MWYKSEQKKKRLRDNARDKCRNLSEEEKNVKKEYGRNRYNNISEKKEIKAKKIPKKITVQPENYKEKIDFFCIVWKIEQEAMYFGENGIIKNPFQKKKTKLILMN